MIRCELSLDGGETWRLADIERHEKPTAYNKYWCWVFWSVAVPGAPAFSVDRFCWTRIVRLVFEYLPQVSGCMFPQLAAVLCVWPCTCGLCQWAHQYAIWCFLAAAVDLLRSTEMRMRAVDSSNNMMPEKLTWNLMGGRARAFCHTPFPFLDKPSQSQRRL